MSLDSAKTVITSNKMNDSAGVFNAAAKVMPGGNTRHSVFFEPFPVYISKAEGKYIWDADGNRYLDCNNNFSSLIHGHCHPAIVKSVTEQLQKLSAVGAPTELEVKLAELLCERYSSMDRIRFCNSGTEAVMLAIKAARAYTTRSKIAKIEGGYHGCYDYAEVSVSSTSPRWGDAKAPASLSPSSGTPSEVAENVLVLPLNDVEAATALLRAHAHQLAALIIDPAPSNIAYVEPDQVFVNALHKICREHGILMIADEVYSLRLDWAGAQSKWSFKPDITAMGKIIGGGFPVGAIGGRADVMQVFHPSATAARVPHGGTFNANPITVTAGRTSVNLFDRAAVAHVNALGARLRRELKAATSTLPLPLTVSGCGSLMAVTYRKGPLDNYRDVCPQPLDLIARAHLHKMLLEQGIFTGPQVNTVLSTVNNSADIDQIVNAYYCGLETMPNQITDELLARSS